jgi:adenosylcobinamide-phosphate synthase
MTLFSIVVALFLDQARPFPAARFDDWLARFARFLDARFNAGQFKHGVIAWLIGAALPTALVLAVQIYLSFNHPLLLLLLAIGTLYATAGFRHFSHYFTDLHLALRMGEIDRARQLLAQWHGRSCDRLGSSEIARLAIEKALVCSHRHVFGPLLCFALLGPAGAVLYRLSRALQQHWGGRDAGETGHFGDFAVRAWAILDWLPARMSATFFAVVGDFEDAVFCWRTQAVRWPDPASGILLASGAGALGVRLGMPIGAGLEQGDRPELGVGDEADVEFMQSTIGLVWRTLVLGLLLLALIWVASWAGN